MGNLLRLGGYGWPDRSFRMRELDLGKRKKEKGKRKKEKGIFA
jgi:hypothetical protein